MSLVTHEEYLAWPAIEGKAAAEYLLELAESDGFALDSDEARKHIIRDRNHWIKVFNGNTDDMLMFADAYNAIAYSKTNFAI